MLEARHWLNLRQRLSEVAKQVGTPCYVYDRNRLLANFSAFQKASADQPEIYYAAKANGNLAILQTLASAGCFFDVVSLGELQRVIHAGGDPSRTVFGGVGKSSSEIAQALELGIGAIYLESRSELAYLASHANQQADSPPIKVGIRVNPDVDAHTHPYISTGLKQHKFGVERAVAVEMGRHIMAEPRLKLAALCCHVGSQIFDLNVFEQVVEHQVSLAHALRKLGAPIERLTFGGGLGVDYQGKAEPAIGRWVRSVVEGTRALGWKGDIALEPGRSLVANTGVLLTSVLHVKEQGGRQFLVVDAAMNDLLRPALYQSRHPIVSLNQPEQLEPGQSTTPYTVVGPVCESADTFGEHELTQPQAGDCLMILFAGAYAGSMASRYNGRPLAAEVMLGEHGFQTVRRRETVQDWLKQERLWVP